MELTASRILTRKKYRQIKLHHLQKVQIWEFGLLIQQITLTYNSFYENLKLKNKVVTGKTPFFVIGPFCCHHFVLTLASDMAVLYRNDALSILVLSAKKRYSNFFEKGFRFQKICFKVKALKTFKIFTDCHIKTCNGGLF